MDNKTLLKACDIINETSIKHNLILEFGTYTGNTLRQLRKMFSPERYTLVGLDSLQGLPEDWLDGDGKLVGRGWTGRFGEGATMEWYNDISDLQFYEGFFCDTVPSLVDHFKNTPAALVHIDCDLYSSTNDILYPLYENGIITSGTVLVFDEWYYNHLNIPTNCQHEQKAFFEWVGKYPNIKYKIEEEVEDERRIIGIIEV